MKIKGIKRVAGESKKYLRDGRHKMDVILVLIDGEYKLICRLLTYPGCNNPLLCGGKNNYFVATIERPHTMRELRELCIAAIHRKNAREAGEI